MAKLKDGFYKQTAESVGSDLHVLLAGGGSKALSDFAYRSDLTNFVTGGPYLPKAGGILTSSSLIPLTIKSTDTYSCIRFISKNTDQVTFGIKSNGALFVTNIGGWSNEYAIYHQGNLTKVSQLTNDAGYLTFEQLVNGVDMNTVKNTGFYYGSSMTNSAASYISSFIVAKYSPDWGAQLQLCSWNSKAYIRYWRDSGGVMGDWKTLAYTSDIPTKVSQLTNDSGFVTGGPYLPSIGGTITGDLTIDGALRSNSGIIRPAATTSNAVPAITFYKGSKSTDFKRDAVIGWYNTGGTNANGALYLIPYPQDTNPWVGSVGLFISQTQLLFEGKTVYHSGNLTKKDIGLDDVQNTAFYRRSTYVNGTEWDMAGTNSNNAFTIYAPTAAGTLGQVLTSSGGTPSWTNQSSLSVGFANNSGKLNDIDSTGFLRNYSQDYSNTISSTSDISPTLTAGVAKVHIYGVEYSSVLTGYDLNNKAWQLRFRPTYNDGIYFRSQGTGTSWKKLAFTSDIPSVGDGTVTIKQAGNIIGSFTMNQSSDAIIELTDTNTNYYPTTFFWIAGSTAGPTGSLTGSGMSSVSFGAIPSASIITSGIVTTGAQTFAGSKTFSSTTHMYSKLYFNYSDSYTTNSNYIHGASGTSLALNGYSTMYFRIAGTSKLTLTSSALYPSTSGGLTLGTISYKFGNVYAASIGTSSYRCTDGYFSNSVYAASGFYESSDERLKNILNPVKVDLDELSTLRKIYYIWKDASNTSIQLGMIAQDVQKLYPELVDVDKETGYLSLAYDKLSVIALSAIDDIYIMLKDLKEENKKLKDTINNLYKLLK